jgi:flagellar assembly protein FliH
MEEKNETSSESIKPANQSHSHKTIYKQPAKTSTPFIIKNRFDDKAVDTPQVQSETSKIENTSTEFETDRVTETVAVIAPNINKEIEQERKEKREALLKELSTEKQTQLEESKLLIDKEIEAYKKEKLENVEKEKEAAIKDAIKKETEKLNLESEKKLTALSKELTTTINSAASEKKKQLESTGKNMLKLGFAIAEKVIQTTIEQDSSLFQNILKEAISKITDKDKVTIKVNPHDLDHAKDYKKSFERELRDFKHLDIQCDDDIESGGCIIETNLGYIDSSISTKLALIERALMDIFEEENPENKEKTTVEFEDEIEENTQNNTLEIAPPESSEQDTIPEENTPPTEGITETTEEIEEDFLDDGFSELDFDNEAL